MGNYGVKVSEPGVDVLTTNNPNDLQFTSQYSTLKLFRWGSKSLTTDGSGNGSVTVPHYLGYAPAHLVFRKGTAQYTFVDASSYPNSYFPLGAVNKFSDDAYHHTFSCSTNSTHLTISCSGGTASTTFNFRYYIFIDLAQNFSGEDQVGQLRDWGFKVSKENKPVLTAKEYEMNYSSKYKSVQFYPQSQFSQDLTLPAMAASYHDTYVEEMTYVDFTHNLGYPPLFIAFANVYSPVAGENLSIQIPFYTQNSIDVFNYSIAGFCDATRVRIYFWRSSGYFISLLDDWSAETVNVRAILFTEKLNSTEQV